MIYWSTDHWTAGRGVCVRVRVRSHSLGGGVKLNVYKTGAELMLDCHYYCCCAAEASCSE